jgi:hypothetical protein
MSYESTNNFYSNNNIRSQQIIDSNFYNRLPSQSQMTNRYQSYPLSSSHQTVSFSFQSPKNKSNKNIQFPPYDTYESRSSGYYPSYTGAYEHQQRSSATNYYGDNHIEVVNYICKSICCFFSRVILFLVITIFIEREWFIVVDK